MSDDSAASSSSLSPYLICPTCQKPAGDITDKTVGEQHYHLYCFNCTQCGQYLQGRFFRDEQSNGLVCPACHTHPIISKAGSVSYIPKVPSIKPTNTNSCPRCGKTVYQAELLRALDQNWHKRCFTCEKCSKALAPGKFETQHEKPYCKTCIGTAYKV